MAIAALDQVRDEVESELRRFLAENTPLVDAVDPDCREITCAVTELVSGGKRLRAAFAAAGWAGVAAPEADHTPVIRAGAALELFQAAALIHDDLIDNSDTRRGAPAVHRRIEQWHTDRGHSGDPSAFGRGAAVLAGDLSLTWARHLIGQATDGLATGARALATYDAMSFQLMGGQFLDMLNQVREPGADALEQARRVLTYKTVQYTVVQPLRIGATMAGADDRTLQSLTDFGAPLGEAFQLRDDLLGVYGDPERTGKPAGDDLREGKRTVLLALAHQACDAEQDALLTRLVGRPDLDDGQVSDLRAAITASGAVEQVEAMITKLHEQSLSALDRAPLHPQARDLLAELAQTAVRRST